MFVPKQTLVLSECDHGTFGAALKSKELHVDGPVKKSSRKAEPLHAVLLIAVQ